ncbi:Calcium-activated chloride channel regulator 4A [Lamellibrachia satsuma]|nr:Calcium-activated chloride channel regulator 4A [Lamellibrachia satsuma]
MSTVSTVVAVCLAVFLVVDMSLAYTTRNEIKLVDNGYEDILVAIGESVPVSESGNMIRRIKTFFKLASHDLFQATYQRVYFRNITILVPKSWGSSTSYDAATTETFSSANVVIDGPEMETPTTWTYGECGQPGEYIQIPIGFTTVNHLHSPLSLALILHSPLSLAIILHAPLSLALILLSPLSLALILHFPLSLALILHYPLSLALILHSPLSLALIIHSPLFVALILHSPLYLALILHSPLSLALILHSPLSLALILHSHLSLALILHSPLSLALIIHSPLFVALILHSPLYLAFILHSPLSLAIILHSPLSLALILHSPISLALILHSPLSLALILLSPPSLALILHSPLSLALILHSPISLALILHSPLSLALILHSPLSLALILHSPLSLALILHSPLSLALILHSPLSLALILHSPLSLAFILHSPLSLALILHSPLSLALILHSPLSLALILHSPLSLALILLSPPSLALILHSPLSLALILHSPLSLALILHSPLSLALILHSPLSLALILHSPLSLALILHSPLSLAPILHSPLSLALILLSPPSLALILHSPLSLALILHSPLSLALILHSPLSLALILHSPLSLALILLSPPSLALILHSPLSLALILHSPLSLALILHSPLSLALILHSPLSLALILHSPPTPTKSFFTQSSNLSLGLSLLLPPSTPSATIVHEWGHLRWGLRDEYPVPGKPRFYHSSENKVTAVKCGKHMIGSHVDHVTRKECELLEDTGLPSHTCCFVPHSSPGVKASLMFFHNVTEVTTFCDNNENNLETLHNDEAPSVHNDLCDRKSAWEIMREHADFRGGNSPAINTTQVSDPTFRLVQAKSKRLVLVLDVSGSMSTTSNGVSRIDKLYRTSADYLNKVIPTGYSVGIVTFSSSASIAASLIEVTSETARKQLVAKLPISTAGNTGIGSGLLRGVDVLEFDGGVASGGILILVSDGQENKPPMMADVTPTLVSKGVIVNTILISDNADQKLVELAAFTKGKSFFDSGSSDSTELQSAFRETVKDSDSEAPGAASVELLLETVSVSSKEEVNRSVSIDSSIGRDTEFTFTYTGSTFPLDVLVTSPSGLNYTVDGPNGRHDSANKQLTISINETEIGVWTVVIRNPGTVSTAVQLFITSKAPTDDSYPLTVRAFLSQQKIDFHDSSSLKLIVRAEVKQGYSPLIGAKVEVKAGTSPWKLMKDDGLGVDVLKDDGYYSAILLSFQKNGFNSVKVRATAKGGNDTRLVTRAGSRAFVPFLVNGTSSIVQFVPFVSLSNSSTSSIGQFAPFVSLPNSSTSSIGQFVPFVSLPNSSTSSIGQFVPFVSLPNSSISSIGQFVPFVSLPNSSTSSIGQFVPFVSLPNSSTSSIGQFVPFVSLPNSSTSSIGDTELGPTYETVEGFDRTADAGVVNVANLDLNTDPKAVYPFPPAKVTDLQVIGMSYENETVTLQWTSVGDYEEQETASSYDIRFTTDIKQLLYSFENATQLNDSDILVGNLSSPLTPSETENFVIRFPEDFNNGTLFIGLKVIHSNTDRVSKVSNIVSAALVHVPPKYPPTTTIEPDYTTEEDTTTEDTTTREPTTEPDETTSIDSTTIETTTQPQDTTTVDSTTTEHTTQPVETTTSATTIIEPTTQPDETITSVAAIEEPTTESHYPSSTSTSTNQTLTEKKANSGVSEKAVFAIKLSIGIAVPLMFLIALPLMIRSVRGTRGTMGTERGQHSSRGELHTNDQYVLPYTIPKANRPTGPRYTRDVSACYLPQTSPYHQQIYGGPPFNPRRYNGAGVFEPQPDY